MFWLLCPAIIGHKFIVVLVAIKIPMTLNVTRAPHKQINNKKVP